MGLSLLISAGLVGLLGGLHCLAMCGGFLAAAAARDAAPGGGPVPLLPAAVIARRQLAYHAGRVTTYMALGAALGSAGAMALNATALLPVQRALYVLGNLFLMSLGASLVLGTAGIAPLQRAGAQVFGALVPRLQPLLRRPGWVSRSVLGLVWGLVPCALVYSVLPLALLAGGAWQGALVMLTFGLATMPSLLASGVLIGHGRRLLQRPAPRRIAAGVLIAFGVAGIWRVMGSPDELGLSVFCVGPW